MPIRRLRAAMGAVVGASPLAGLSSHPLNIPAALIGPGGFVCLGATMIVILRVMQPPAVSYADIETAKPRHGLAKVVPAWLYQHKDAAPSDWKKAAEDHEDLYLPCGVVTLRELRTSMGLEQATLVELARAREDATDTTAVDDLGKAQTTRATQLLEFRAAAAQITAVGEYYVLRARSVQATYGGAILGTLGTVAIVLAFAWPFR
jgi:hypothetical protein